MQYITCVETAKLIRAALKESFPSIKFSVKSSSYAGGASINVSYVDGPTQKEVESVATDLSAIEVEKKGKKEEGTEETA